MYTLRCEMVVDMPLREVFSIFEDPKNLTRITPPWLQFRVTTPCATMCKGAEIDYKIRWMGLPMRWKTLITEYEPPYFFVDTQELGPYVLWHHQHEFRETCRGTHMADRVDYILPYGRIGKLAHCMMVGCQLKEIFEYRQTALAEIMQPAQIRITPPVICAGG